MPRLTTVAAVLLLALAGCATGERLGTEPPPTAPRTRVAPPADNARMAWDRAGRMALRSALPVNATMREAFRLPVDTIAALAWTIELAIGERLGVELAGDDAAVEVFEHLGGETWLPRELDGATFTAPRTGRYVLRVKPDFGRDGEYELSLDRGVSVTFPVQGGTTRSVKSWFGDSRDGGSRNHNGVDIFAPRGTPVLSVSEAVVRAVHNTPVGGKVIWTEDVERALTYYYAHLDEQLVEPGTRVRPGEIIGRVGNTGNASGASPHLHFGVYLPGTRPIDPLPYLQQLPEGGMPEPLPDSARHVLGRRVRTNARSVRLRAGASETADIIAELDEGVGGWLLGATGDWRRVLLHDGRFGFISARLLGPDM